MNFNASKTLGPAYVGPKTDPKAILVAIKLMARAPFKHTPQSSTRLALTDSFAVHSEDSQQLSPGALAIFSNDAFTVAYSKAVQKMDRVAAVMRVMHEISRAVARTVRDSEKQTALVALSSGSGRAGQNVLLPSSVPLKGTY